MSKLKPFLCLANLRLPTSNRQIERSFNLLEGIRHNWLFIAVTCLMTGAQTLIMFVGGRAFSITKLTGDQWAYSVVLGAISIPIGFLLQIVPTVVIEKPIKWLQNMWNLLQATVMTLSFCIFLC
jgi:Ca2+-transporting ATPase